MGERVPTPKQTERLLVFGSGSMLVSGIGSDRQLRSALRWGWLAPETPGDDNGLRITATGLRALAAAVDRYGLPPMNVGKLYPAGSLPIRGKARDA